MKKTLLFIMMGLALMCTSCKSSKNAYQQAYEKAKGQETDIAQVNAPMQVSPVTEQPSDTWHQAVEEKATPVVNTPAAVTVRQEQVTPVAVKSTLKAYSVVCGSFGVQANAENLNDYLISQGYDAGIVKNIQKNMYRVIIGSWNTKQEAINAREQFKARFPGREDFQESWILWNK